MYVELRLLDRTSLVLESIEYKQLPDFTEVSFSSVLSDIGFLEFSYPSDLAESLGLKLQSWIAVAVGSNEEDTKIYDPLVVDWFIIENTSVSKAADGETVAQFQGRSWMSRLEDACVMPYGYDPDVPPPVKYPNWDGGSGPTGPTGPEWAQWPGYGTESTYNNQTAGAILWDVLDKAQRRETIPTYDLQLWFDGYVDSFGYNPEMEGTQYTVRVAHPGDVTPSGLKLLDGVEVQDGDAVLLRQQTDPKLNGLWIVRAPGTGPTPPPWERHWANNAPGELKPGDLVYVRQGVTNAGKLFAAEFTAPHNPGVTPVTFAPRVSTSRGRWLRTWTGSWSAETKIYEMMRDLVEGGVIEARVSVPVTDVETGKHQPPRLEVWDSDNMAKEWTIEKSNPVVFRPGLNMKDHEEATDSRETLNKVFALGDGAKQLIEKTTGADAMTFLGRWREELAVFDEVSEQYALEELAEDRLLIVVHPLVQETAGIAPSVYLPWSDYLVGDWVLLDIGQGNTATDVQVATDWPGGLEKYYEDRMAETTLDYSGAVRPNYGSLYPVRIREINVRENENGEVEVAVTLNDIIYEQNIKTQRLINSILTGQGAVAGAGRLVDDTIPPVVAWDYSKAPASVASLDAFGNPVAYIEVAWLPYSPAVLDLKGYAVRWRDLDTNEAFGEAMSGPPNKVTYQTPTVLIPGHTYEFIVQGVDEAGNSSDRSSGRSVKAARDAIAPPIPYTPLATLSGGANSQYVSVYWNGKDASNTTWLTMVPDFSRVELHFGGAIDFTPGPATFSGSVYTSADTKTNPLAPGIWYARLVAIDDTGNRSDPSVASDPVEVLP